MHSNSAHIQGIVLRAALSALCFFALFACGGGGGGGSASSSSDEASGPDPGPEASSLYGVNETPGEFGVSIDEFGVMTITPVGSPSAGLAGTSSRSGSTLTLNLAATNALQSSMTRVRLMLAGLPSGVTLSGNDGRNYYSLGDIGMYGLASATVTLNNAQGAFDFNIYITQQKEQRPSAVLDDADGGSPSSASLFKYLNNGKTEAGMAKAKTGTVYTAGGANVSLKIDAYGNPKASYLHPDNHDLRYAYWDGSAYQNVTVYSTGKVGFYSSLALTTNGNPRIAYYSSEDSSGTVTGDLKYAYCNSNCGVSSSWGGITIDSTGDVGGHTSMALDNTDPNNPKPRIAYYDFTNQNLKFAFCDATCNLAANWTIYTVDSTGNVGQYASLALTSTGGPKMSYYDASNGNLKYASCSGSVSTWCDTWYTATVDSSSSDVGAYTSIALYNDNPKISYYDLTNGDLKYAWYGTYSTGTGNIGAEVELFGGTDMSQPYSPTILSYVNGSGQTRYRMYYSRDQTGTCGFMQYMDTNNSQPPSPTNIVWSAKTIYQGWYAGQGCFSVAPMGDIIPTAGGKYTEYHTFFNDEFQHWIDYRITTTTDGTLPYCDGFDGSTWDCGCAACTSNIASGASPNGTAAVQSISDPPISQYYPANPTVIQYVNGSGQTRYRIYFIPTDERPTFFAYRDTNDANAPWCMQWSPTISGESGDGWNRFCKTGNISGVATQTNIVTDYNYGRAELVQLPDGKWRMYYSQDGELVYRDTTDNQPPGLTNIGDLKQLNVTGYGPELVPTATGYRLYYFRTIGGYRKVAYRDTTDSNLPTASGTTGTTWVKITVDDSMFVCTHTCANGLGAAWFYNDNGAFSSLSLDANGKPRISYYHNDYWVDGGLACATTCDSHDSEGDLMYATCTADDCSDKSSWSIQTLDSSNDTGWFSSTASTAGGHAFTAYYDATAKDLKIYTISSNLDGRKDINTGGASTSQTENAEVVRLYNNKYRLYYHKYDGTKYDICYKDTTDTNPPDTNGSNLGSEVTLIAGTSSTDYVNWPELIRKSDNTYRFYYKYYDGSTRRIAYRDTYNINPPPFEENLGAQTSLGVATSRMPNVVRFTDSSGKYRIYYADFNATYGRIAYRDTTTTDWSLPGASNVGAANLLGIGGTVNDNLNAPRVVAMAGGKYRLYYTKNNGTYLDIMYRDTTTTDGSFPDSTNIGVETPMGLGSNPYFAGYSDVVSLGNGKYRLYYSKRTDGTTYEIVYRDTTTTDGSLPGAGNLGPEVVMGITGSATGGAQAPRAVQIAGGLWRLYYTYYTTYFQLAFRQTTDTNPPSETNIGTIRYLYTGTASPNSAYGPEVVRFDDASAYRLYYMTSNAAWEIAYKDTTDASSPHDFLTLPVYLPFNANSNLGFKVIQKPDASGWRFYETGYNGTYIKIRYWDTTDANPPEATNIGGTVTDIVGGTSTEDAVSPEVLQLPNGRYRLYYHYRPGSPGYFQLAYRDLSDANLPDATNLGSLQLLGVEGGTVHALSSELLLMDSGFYRMYYSISSSPSYYRELVFKDTIDGDPPTAY